MKIVNPSFDIWEQQDMYSQIERAGRVCYKSENKMTDSSAARFVNSMINNNHLAMLEHGAVYLKIPYDFVSRLVDNKGKKYLTNPYSKCKVFKELSYKYLAVTTNFRVLVENDWTEDLVYQCEPTEYHAKRITVHFICDMGVAREFTRHRVFSFAQESTRYCNYSKNKFGNELTFIQPCWDINSANFVESLECAEHNYLELIKQGWQAQQARNILPLALKTELVMTGFVEDWEHFFYLRHFGTTGKPHPQAKELAEPLYEEFVKQGYISSIPT